VYSVFEVNTFNSELTRPSLVVEEEGRDGELLVSVVSTSTSNGVSSLAVKPYNANTGTG
jgi:hypothetical protein